MKKNNTSLYNLQPFFKSIPDYHHVHSSYFSDIDPIHKEISRLGVQSQSELPLALTLTCRISGVTTPVEVTWRERYYENWYNITNGENGFAVFQGSVNENQVQEATLTITPTTLSDMMYSSNVNEKLLGCAAKSTLYPESPQSKFRELQVTFLTLSTYRLA